MHEPVMFHKAYPLDSFLEEARIMEKERELMLSYLPEEYRNMQRKVEETCDKMEYEGSRMYDEHPDGTVIRQITKRIMEELKRDGAETAESENVGRYQEDIVCCFLCNEMLRRRYRTWRSRRVLNR